MARRRNGVSGAEPPRERAEEVYAAALRLFREKGYHATSMQDIAAALGLYKGSLYHYIGGKEDLLVAVFERAMAGLLDQVEPIATDESLGPAQQLRLVIEAHVQAVASNLDALTVYLHDFRALAGEALEPVRKQRERYQLLLQRIIERGVRAGELATDDVGLATLGVLGMCNWIVQWYRPDGRLSASEIGQRFAEMVLDGLYLPSTSSPSVSPKVCTSEDE
jgi:AcrR family transcriptional regulator